MSAFPELLTRLLPGLITNAYCLVLTHSVCLALSLQDDNRTLNTQPEPWCLRAAAECQVSWLSDCPLLRAACRPAAALASGSACLQQRQTNAG